MEKFLKISQFGMFDFSVSGVRSKECQSRDTSQELTLLKTVLKEASKKTQFLDQFGVQKIILLEQESILLLSS